MATELERLSVLIEANTKSYERAMIRLEKKTAKAMNASSRSVRRLDTRMKALSNSAAAFGRRFVALAVVAGLARFGSSTVKTAADLEEMQSKFDAVFKDLSVGVSQWADDHARAINRSSIDLREYLSTLQDTFVPLGFSRQRASELSKQLTELAVDVASFNNTADATVIQLFTSALVGNHEAVRRFGIVITEASVKAELLRLGIKGGTKGATEQQKVLARLNLIMNSTKDAQGDAAKTAQSFTNKTKGLDAALKDLSGTLGKFVTDNSGPLLKFLTDAAKGAAILADSLRTVGSRTNIAGLQSDLSKLFAEREKIRGKIERGSKKVLGIFSFTSENDPNIAALKQQLKDINGEAVTLLDRITELQGRGGQNPFDSPAKPEKPAATQIDQKSLDKQGSVIEGLRFEGEQLQRTAAQQELYNNLKTAAVSIDSAAGQRIAALTEANRSLEESQRSVNEQTQFFGDLATDALSSIFVHGEKASDTLRRLARSIADAALQATLLGQGPLAGLFGAGAAGGSAGSVGGLFGKLFGGARAAGGPVSPGKGFLVGERGPELFMPKSAGQIVPNGGGGRASTTVMQTINIDASGAQAGVAEQMAAVLPAIVKRASQVALAELIFNIKTRPGFA